jgi:mercuric ion transport protein
VKVGAGSYLSLFTSFGTLLCCGLPSLLILFGLGATVASFLSALPWLVTLSNHKNWVFLIAGLLIAGNFIYLTSRAKACPTDAADACAAATRTSRVVLWISAAIYCIGIFSAYILGPLLMKFAG